MLDLKRYNIEDVYLCSLSNDSGYHIRKEPFISERNPDFIINPSKDGKVLRSLRSIEYYYHIDSKEPISDYLEVVPTSLSRGEIFRIADAVNDQKLKPKTYTKSIYN